MEKKFEGVGYDEKYDDDMEICRFLALSRYCLEPIRCRLNRIIILRYNKHIYDCHTCMHIEVLQRTYILDRKLDQVIIYYLFLHGMVF